MSDNPVAIYRSRFDACAEVAKRLRVLVESHLAGVPNIDRVTARPKDPDRFAEKVSRRDKDGEPKYRWPLTEIQDQLGVRVVVFYLASVETVGEILLRYLQEIEQTQLVPESHWEFGYFGRHYVMALPGDVVPKGVDVGDVPRFFELQIKTLFQHAWSEANHDLGYKQAEPLTGEQERLLAFAAAQAWGADRAFQELRTALTL
jgi:putative GTP pyrophosphokinase